MSGDHREHDERKPKPKAEDRAQALDPRQEHHRRRLRLVLFATFGAVVLCAAVGYAWYYFTAGRYLATTDDAYTGADNTTISPQVAGTVSELLVTDNQPVVRGQALLRIDDRPFRAAVDQAAADASSAKAQIDNLAAQIDAQQSQIQQANADVATAKANLSYAQANNARFSTLSKTGAASIDTAQQTATALRAQTAALDRSEAALSGAQKQLKVLLTQKEAAEAMLQHNQAALEQAQINLGYATITSPIDGAIGDRSVRAGLYVQPGAQLMTIVPMRKDIYVVANFKETDLTDMYRGQRVDVAIDTFPSAHLRGVVDSLAPGSGSQFSLLPPENATGNFVKIVQRVPVKIWLDSDDDIIDRLRPGLSVEVTVDTRTTPPGRRSTLAEDAKR